MSLPPAIRRSGAPTSIGDGRDAPGGWQPIDDGWFLVLWPVALLFHLGSNSRHLSGLVHDGPNPVALGQLAMAVAAGFLLVQGSRSVAASAVALLASLQLAVTSAKLPVIGNHEMILALVSLVVLASLIPYIRAGSPSGYSAWMATAAPALRWVFLVSYGFIAFSKLNTGFLDPDVSCARVFGDEMAKWFGLNVRAGTWPALVAIYGTVLIELLVPALLLWSRTRSWGVALALVFHTVLALDPDSHVVDFTSTLVPLLMLFTPASVRELLTRDLHRLIALAGRRTTALVLVVLALSHGLVLRTGTAPWSVAMPVWLAAMATLGWWLVVRGRSVQRPRPTALGRPGRLALVVVLLAALNGLAPYLEVKTAHGFNMYSNLHTANGATNHLLVPATLPLRPLDLVTVQSAEAGPLAYYSVGSAAGVDESNPMFALPRENVEHLLGVRLVAETDPNSGSGRARPGDDPLGGAVLVDSLTGSRLVARDVGSDRSILDRLRSGVLHRLALRRTVVISEPRACLRSWGPLY